MKIQVKDNKDEFFKSLNALIKKKVIVGIPSDKTERNDDEPITNAEIGYISEFGDPERNIPQREFLRPGVELVKSECAIALAKAIHAVFDKSKGDPEIYLHATGIKASTSVKGFVEAGNFINLSDYTIFKRKLRGRTGTKPLIDTGQFLASITYGVRDDD